MKKLIPVGAAKLAILSRGAYVVVPSLGPEATAGTVAVLKRRSASGVFVQIFVQSAKGWAMIGKVQGDATPREVEDFILRRAEKAA